MNTGYVLWRILAIILMLVWVKSELSQEDKTDKEYRDMTYKICIFMVLMSI